jgi:hypothetical protein
MGLIVSNVPISNEKKKSVFGFCPPKIPTDLLLGPQTFCNNPSIYNI